MNADQTDPPEQPFVGTMPVPERLRIDEARLREYLRAHLHLESTADLAQFSSPLGIEQFKGGQSNPTFKLRAGDSHYVMRTKPGPAAKLLPSAHAIDREFKVMRALKRAGLPVATMHTLCEDESVIGRAFYIMEFVAGRVLWDQSLPGLSNGERAAVYNEMNAVIAALHKADIAAIGLSDFGKPGNYFARQIGRWSKQYQASATEKIPAMDQLIAWLPANIPIGDETSVVHGDYRMDNLIFHPTEPRVLAILDWELSTLGHPLADFSYHCMSWHIPPGAFRGIGGLDLKSLGIPSESEYVAAYCERTGRGPIPPDHWNFYLAYNLFRLAAILQGIMKRYMDGTAASDQALDAGKRARALGELGWEYAQKIR